MDLKEEVRRLAKDGYSMAETAEILGITYYRVKTVARHFNIQFKTSFRKSLERKKRFVELYDAGATRSMILEKLGISRSTYEVWKDQIHVLRMEIRHLWVDDPRSFVCQQIERCSHSRCYLSSRCPAYQRYIEERNQKKQRR